MKNDNSFIYLKDKILSKKAKIGVIGLGYVGLPLALEFTKAGYPVTGIDIDSKKIQQLNNANSYVTDISNKEIKTALQTKRFHVTADYTTLKTKDVIFICVPTPLRKTKEPDISYIVDAVNKIVANLITPKLIILESTTYPGTTEEVLVPILSTTGKKLGRDFFALFSPERVDPGNEKYKTHNIPKVVGGETKQSSQLGKLLYGQIVDTVITVGSSKVAEMVKMYENTFRSVNIGLANELSLVCNNLGIDAWEVIDAAKSKPFGFMPFYPGPGIGGHCIPLDPHYLSWKARLHGFETRFIDLASLVNMSMPKHVAYRLMEILNKRKKSLYKSKILVMGVTYKKDVADSRESPSLEILRLLKDKGAIVSFYDPFVNTVEIEEKKIKRSLFNAANIKKYDCVLIVTDHSNIDYDMLVKNAKVIFDTRNVLKNQKKYRKKIITL